MGYPNRSCRYVESTPFGGLSLAGARVNPVPQPDDPGVFFEARNLVLRLADLQTYMQDNDLTIRRGQLVTIDGYAGVSTMMLVSILITSAAELGRFHRHLARHTSLCEAKYIYHVYISEGEHSFRIRARCGPIRIGFAGEAARCDHRADLALGSRLCWAC
jgi:hypothetical protein